MVSYAGQIAQAATKAKNDGTVEDRLLVYIENSPQGTHQQGFAKRLRTCVGHAGGRQIDHNVVTHC